MLYLFTLNVSSMKIKNFIILGGIVFAIYYLTKKKPTTTTATLTPDIEGGDSTADIGDKDLTDVSNGDEPKSLSESDKLKLFNQANLSYRGGARPTQKLLADISVKKYQAELRLKELGLLKEFYDWKAKIDGVRKLPTPYPMMGKPRIGVPRPVGDIIMIKRDKMPLPRNKTYAIDTTSSLGLTNMPPMAV